MPAITAEVWGSPIGHSRSPDLQLAAYKTLGITGEYSRREVTADTLADTFSRESGRLTGVSLTMPLKTGIVDLVGDHRGDVDLLEAANTAVKGPDGWWLDNTDPLGAEAMLRRLLPGSATTVWLVGAGATAKSVVLGLARAGFSGDVLIRARSKERSQPLSDLAARCGLSARFHALGAPGAPPPGLVVTTLPSGTPVDQETLHPAISAGATLIDVGYHPWPTPIATLWEQSSLPVHSGLPMLIFQALGQIRAFVNGDSTVPLDAESAVLEAMCDAVSVERGWAHPAHVGQ
jgi:shikimate dehydrogenase